MLARESGLEDVAAALELALERGTPRRSSVEGLLRATSGSTWSAPRVPLSDADLASMRIEAPELSRYDALLEVR